MNQYCLMEFFCTFEIITLAISSMIKNKRINNKFTVMLWSVAASIFFDGMTWFCYGHSERLIPMKIFWIVAYISLTISILLYHNFILTSLYPKNHRIFKTNYIAWAVALVTCVLWIVSMFNNMFYIIDENAIFSYTKWHILSQLGCGGLVVIMDVIIILQNAKNIKPIKTFALAAYLIFPLIMVFFEFIIDSAILVYLGITLATLIEYLIISVEDSLALYKISADNAKKELELENERRKLMVSQIQPHFIYNSLTAIEMIEGNPDETVNAINDFARYLRGNLASLDLNEPIPFKTEFKNVMSYVNLEKLRFKDRLNFVTDIQCDDFVVPALTVQVIVENSIKHGISKKRTGGTVILSTYQDENNYYINIEDDGVGFDFNSRPAPDNLDVHVGLKSCGNRIAYMVNGTLEINSEIGVGVKTLITIPKKEEANEAK